MAAEAVRIARASATAKRRAVVLDDRPPAHGHATGRPYVDRPVRGLGRGQGRAPARGRADHGRGPRASPSPRRRYSAQREWKSFAASDGSETDQEITHVVAALEANAVDGDELQRRSLPGLGPGSRLGVGASGSTSSATPRASRPRRSPSSRRRSASRGAGPIILDPSQLYMQVHESCGHPTELDRVFGTEASYAGTSFLTTDKLADGFRYGSDLVTIVADATSPGGMGTFGWDDEGVAAQRVPLVQDGILAGYLTSRETAPRIGRQSGGAMRADGWDRIPLIRMTNINLLPREGMSLADIVADTDDGLYLASNRSWSIDDRRLNFQFATEVAYEIKGGKLGGLVKNPTYTGITYEFWRSCDAVADASSYVLFGTPNCGKGEPGQIGHVGHGASGARFRDVQVGVGKW